MGTNAMRHAVNRFSIVLQPRSACALRACSQKGTAGLSWAELRELHTAEQCVYSLNGRKDAFLCSIWSSVLLLKLLGDVYLLVFIHKFRGGGVGSCEANVNSAGRKQ